MADHGTTLTEARVRKFKSRVKKGFRYALSGMDTKKSDTSRGESSHAKTAGRGESSHAKTKSTVPNVAAAKSGARKVKTVTIAAPGAEEKPKPEAASKETETNKRNKVSADRRKVRRKSDDSKFDFAGAINRQLTGR